MKKIKKIKGILILAMTLLVMNACDDKLTELNENPNAVNPADGNANLLMPSVLGPTASSYLNLGLINMAGAMQQLQASGWGGSINYFEWDGSDWTSYYDNLRTNQLLIEVSRENGFAFHEGVGLVMRAFLFGQIADYWGDAPYSTALKGAEGELEFQYPAFDSQESIYMGVIADLEAASALFATGDDTFVDENADLYYAGDMEAWERFANSLLIRYWVRLSEKKASEAKSAVEAIVASGKYISRTSEDATMDYTGGADDQWPLIYDNEQSSTRYQSCKTFIDQLTASNDPRLSVWFDPVQVRWVQDTNISGFEDVMYIDGVESAIWPDWIDYQGSSATFTRKYNPNDVTFIDSEYVGVEPGILISEIQSYNGNPSPGQGRHNVHVSMMTSTFMDGHALPGDLLQSRLLSAAEMHFTLAEMALQGWNVGDAEEHYNAGIGSSLEVWGVADQYADFVAQVAFDGTVEQIITQKWVASFTSATEAWNDYKRTGFPVLSVGNGAPQPVPAVRFGYGGDELNNNTDNVNSAIDNLETTDYSGQLGKDSPYSKPWLLQGTGNPW